MRYGHFIHKSTHLRCIQRLEILVDYQSFMQAQVGWDICYVWIAVSPKWIVYYIYGNGTMQSPTQRVRVTLLIYYSCINSIDLTFLEHSSTNNRCMALGSCGNDKQEGWGAVVPENWLRHCAVMQWICKFLREKNNNTNILQHK